MRILVEFKGLSRERQLYPETSADSLPPHSPKKLSLAVLPPKIATKF